MSKDKRASLSSGLLGSKDAASPGGNGAPSADSAVADDTAKAEPRANLLYSKGAASASSFRPPHWSYEDGPGEPDTATERAPEPRSTITPFPGNALSAQAATPNVPQPLGQTHKRAIIAASVAILCAATASILAYGSYQRSDHASVAAGTAASSTAAVPATPKPAPQAPTSSPALALSARDIAALMARGDQLLADGDIVAARGFYERAAEQGSAPALAAVGKTYDPGFLDQLHVRGTRGDAGLAAQWYRRAIAAGDPQAELHLKKLIARYAG